MQIAGSWEAIWANPTTPEWEYSATLQIKIQDGQVTGTNSWRVVRSPYNWTGKTAKELLSGTYDAAKRLVLLEGRSKEDPDDVIALDCYRLTLSRDGRALSGSTKSSGDWSVSAKNAQPNHLHNLFISFT